MNVLFSACALAALAALVAFSVTYSRRRAAEGTRLALSDWGWAAPAFATLAFLAGWGAAGLVEGNPVFVVVFCAVIVASGACALARADVRDWYERRSPGQQKALKVALPVALMLLSLLAIEYPYNEWMPFGGLAHAGQYPFEDALLFICPSYFWLEMLLAGLLLAGLYFLGQRHAFLCGAGVGLFLITGIGQYFIRRFKNAAILPTDLMALGTAAAVSKEYVFTLNDRAVGGIAFALACVGLLSLVIPPRAQGGAPARVARNLAASAASFGLLAALVLVPSYMDLLGVQIKYWYSIDFYQMQGFYPTFIAVLQDMPIKRPEGYTEGDAERLTQEYAQKYRQSAQASDADRAAAEQFEKEKPTVIAIMNESFADLSVFDGMHAGYEGPEFFKTGLSDALAKGRLNVTVHGAGTCNTEFEFLTGNALGFVGAGKYPYSIYDLSGVDALAAEFKALGYDTCAIHPNYASNWNRDKIYPQMGFDTYLAIDDFGGMPDCAVDKVTPEEPHCEVFHSGVSDKATYDRVLQLLEESERPQFVFDVTMANHGSYNQNNIPAPYLLDYRPADFVGEETPERLNEYLSCIQKSDDDLREFVGKLRALDRPVVLVFFGDHQPSLSLEYNDYWYADEPEDVHARRAFSTDYVIWANYDVAGREQNAPDDETSVDMLGAMTLDLIGAPVSDYQAAQLEIRKLVPSLSSSDYQGADRQWYVPEAQGAYAQAYHDLSLIEYQNFATRV